MRTRVGKGRGPSNGRSLPARGDWGEGGQDTTREKVIPETGKMVAVRTDRKNETRQGNRKSPGGAEAQSYKKCPSVYNYNVSDKR